MVTYIIGKAYDKKFLRRNIKKKLSDVDRQKNTLAPPPQISNDASLKGAVLNIKFGPFYIFKFLRRNIKKKLSNVDRQKNTLAPPPQISNDASLKGAVLNIKFGSFYIFSPFSDTTTPLM